MSTVINTNLKSINAHKALKNSAKTGDKAATRLATGSKLNNAADDAAGLAISEKMKAQIAGMRRAQQNVEDGVSLIETADGGMSEITSMLIRNKELIVQALNDSNTDEDRDLIQLEIDLSLDQIDNLANNTKFNDIPLLNVPADSVAARNFLFMQSGPMTDQSVYVDTFDCRTQTLDINPLLVKPREVGNESLEKIDRALDLVTGFRAKNGAQQNRLEHIDVALGVSFTNLEDANSRIADTDMAKEMMNLTKSNVLSNASSSMLAQANQSAQSVLELLRA